jgi:hypothetical protein
MSLQRSQTDLLRGQTICKSDCYPGTLEDNSLASFALPDGEVLGTNVGGQNRFEVTSYALSALLDGEVLGTKVGGQNGLCST